MPKWLRLIFAIILAFLGAGVWGFVSVYLGFPTIVTSLGAFIIGTVVIVTMLAEK